MTAPTIGLVFDLGTSQGQGALEKALQDFPNKDFRSGAQSAKENQMKFILAAGRLDRANGGIVLILTRDEDDAILGFTAANRRLAGYGVTSTHWIVAGDPGFQKRASQAALPGKGGGKR
jgi:hypothetical protein